MEPMTLTFGVLVAYLNQAILQMDDPRQVSSATKYSLKDAVLAAFSIFFTQSKSCLDYQWHQERHQGSSNARSLFEMMSVPTVPQICNVIDGIPATALPCMFHCVYRALQQDAIEKPASHVNLTIEPQMIADVKGEPGSLPLLHRCCGRNDQRCNENNLC
jgi:hypothetical protein